MGQEIVCRVEFGGNTSVGKALLESSEILFRGDFRLRISVASVTGIKAQNGHLRVKTADGVAVFGLGERAEKWCEKILNPKSVIEKLGVRCGDTVALHGVFDKQFRETLKKCGARVVKDGDAPWVFFEAQDRADLSKIKAIAGKPKGGCALWLVYPRGQKNPTEREVREAGLRHGLKDVKVARFSDTHTALKFVLPKSSR